MVTNQKTANDMDRKVFKEIIDNYFYNIIMDEVKYLNSRETGLQIVSPLESKKKRIDLYDKQIGELYYFYDTHKLQFKDYLGNKSVNLDRHKLAVVFLCMLIDYKPIVFVNKYSRKITYTPELLEEMALVNYRVAFRCACAYASSALFNSFDIRIKECKDNLNECNEERKAEIETSLHKFEAASNILKQNAVYYFPKTREHLDKYVDTYIKVLYSQFNFSTDKQLPPYGLLADTFYWIDVYNKLQLGLEVKPEEYPNGLSRNGVKAESQEEKELTVTEDSQTAKLTEDKKKDKADSKKAKGKKK